MVFPAHVAVIDPAVKLAEIESFNLLVGLSPLPLTYHLPAMQGMKSLEKEVENLKGIILFGSLSSVNDRLPWQDTLEKWLRPRLEAKMPTFGCCYGHQMLAYMFGGKVNYRTPEKEKQIGFREVALTQDTLWGNAQKGKMFVSHNEIVTDAPSCMSTIATSSEYKFDGLRHKTLPIWSFQPHPEATNRFAEVRGVTPEGATAFNFGYSLLKRFLDYCAQNR